MRRGDIGEGNLREISKRGVYYNLHFILIEFCQMLPVRTPLLYRLLVRRVQYENVCLHVSDIYMFKDSFFLKTRYF